MDDLLAPRMKLGDYSFDDVELPESLTPALAAVLVKHDLPGGVRVVDVMGAFYDPISWSGTFQGADAVPRAQYFETLVKKRTTLTWDSYAFDVVVQKFSPQYLQQYRIDYSITVEVIAQAAPDLGLGGLPGLDELVNSDVGKLLGLSSVINVQEVTDAINTIDSAVSQVENIAQQVQSTVRTIITPIVAAQQLVQRWIYQLQSSTAKITTLGGLLPGNPVFKSVNNVLMQANAAVQLEAFYNMQDVLGRMNKNLSAYGSGGQRTVTVAGGSLYRVAAQQYGDPAQWQTIATANGLTDPQITGVQTLKLP